MKPSAQDYRLLFESNPNPMWIFDEVTLQFLEVNEAAVRLYGWSREEFLGMTVKDVRPRQEVPKLLENMAQQRGSRLAFVGEWRHWRKDHTVFDVEVMISCIQFQGRDARLAMVKDVTERKQAVEALRANLDAMTQLRKLGLLSAQEVTLPRVLAKVVDVAIAIAGADFANIQLLDRASGDLKIAAQRGFPKWWVKFWNNVSKGKGVCGTALERGKRIIVGDVEQSKIFAGTPTLKMQRKAGVRAVQSTPLVSRSGKVVGLLSTHYRTPHRPEERTLSLLDLLARQTTDLIEHAQTGAALRESEERRRLAMDIGLIGAWETNLKTGDNFWDPDMVKLLGVTAKDAATAQQRWLEFVHPDDSPRVRAAFTAASRTGRPPYDCEFRVIRADGLERWFHSRGILVERPSGARLMRGMMQDITARKRAEEAVRASRARAELLTRLIGRLLTATDPQTVVKEVCDEIRQFLHCAVFFNYLLDVPRRRLRFNACGGVDSRVARLVEGLALSSSLCGTAARYSRRVLAENLRVKFDTRSEVVRRLGVRAYACHPLLGPGGQAFGTLSFGATDRDTFSAEDLALMKTAADHVAFAMLRHGAEEAVRTSEQRLALATSGAGIGLFEWNIATSRTLWTEQCARLLGFGTTTTMTTTLSLPHHYRDWTKRVHPEDLPGMQAELRRCMRKRRPFEMEYRLVWPDKSLHWMAARGVFLHDARGKPERMLGVMMDISDRKQAELALKEFSATLERRVVERTRELSLANQRLHAVMDTALIGILTLDEQGVIKSVNRAVARIFGYAPQELLEAEVSRLMASHDQPRDGNFLSHFLQSNRKQALGTVGEVLGRHKDGHAMMLEFNLVELPASGGGRFIAMVRDISLRKRLERELLEVGDRERQRLGHDLHDGLGQHLHALYYMASLLEKEMKTAAPEQAHEAGRIAQQLEHGLELTRSLARGLQPVNAVPEGLMVALRELAERTRALYRVDCRFRCRNRVLIQRHAAANHLYRIAQEAVNNAMKHGKPTRIRLHLAEVGERIILGIRDNGIGIRRETTRSQGMGLRVMQFRADAIRGSLAVQRHPQGGTEVVCSVTRKALIVQPER